MTNGHNRSQSPGAVVHSADISTSQERRVAEEERSVERATTAEERVRKHKRALKCQLWCTL